MAGGGVGCRLWCSRPRRRSGLFGSGPDRIGESESKSESKSKGKSNSKAKGKSKAKSNSKAKGKSKGKSNSKAKGKSKSCDEEPAPPAGASAPSGNWRGFPGVVGS
ncbi:hypothetical protein, partial [Catenulispora subtropica]|uniref:hypothetical protein n=1 Tax=Catenulispora subtropica TaxID=450798 RepID=UPI0031DD0F6E